MTDVPGAVSFWEITMNIKYSSRICLPLAVLLSTLASPAVAQIPRVISFQGVLLDESGNRRPDGTYVLTFALYDSDSGSGAMWTETQSADVENGVFSVNLGEVNPLSPPFDKPYWLGTSVDGAAELTPRIAITAAPYSLSDVSSKYFQFGGLNYDDATVTSTFTKLPTTPESHEFEKNHDDTRIEVHVNTQVAVGTLDGAFGIRFEVRIDDQTHTWGNNASIHTAPSTREDISIYAVFENLAAGTHTVSLWARTAPDGSSASNVLVDSGGWGGNMIVKETW